MPMYWLNHRCQDTDLIRSGGYHCGENYVVISSAGDEANMCLIAVILYNDDHV